MVIDNFYFFRIPLTYEKHCKRLKFERGATISESAVWCFPAFFTCTNSKMFYAGLPMQSVVGAEAGFDVQLD